MDKQHKQSIQAIMVLTILLMATILISTVKQQQHNRKEQNYNNVITKLLKQQTELKEVNTNNQLKQFQQELKINQLNKIQLEYIDYYSFITTEDQIINRITLKQVNRQQQEQTRHF